MDKYIEVHIKKPVYSDFVYVRDKYIFEARRKGLMLKISCPLSECIVSPDDWLMNAKKLEKVFLRPDKPMILYGNSISKFVDHTEEEAEQGRLF